MQMHGRAARNARGECHLFADAPFTDAIADAVAEVNRRREKQRDFNERNGIVPVNASAGSSSSSLSLFQVMAEEIAEERAQIEVSSTRSANARVATGTRYGGDDDASSSGSSGSSSAGFAPSEEEVQAALKAWRMKRNGVADAAAAALKARAVADAAREATDSLVGTSQRPEPRRRRRSRGPVERGPPLPDGIPSRNASSPTPCSTRRTRRI